MRIGMLLHNQFPPDIRVEKELNSLRHHHEVFLLCTRRKNAPVMETWNGVRIRRIFSTLKRWWSIWRLMSTCYSHLWAKEIYRYIKSNRLDVLHVHDLPLLGTAIKVARPFGIPVVADLHENFPALLEACNKESLWRCITPGDFVVRISASVEKWIAYETAAVSKADAVITVIEEARDRLIGIGIEPSRIHVVANYNSIAERYNQKQHSESTTDFKMIYAGGFGAATRDLHTLIDAVVLLKQESYTGFKVILAGGVGRELSQLREYAENRGVKDLVVIHEWLPREEAERLMEQAKVGLVPHVKSAHTDSTIPHKIFQYMFRKLPVIVSNCTPLERIVKTANCGLIYQSGNSRSLADCLKRLYSDPISAERFGNAGHQAVLEKYNWHVAAENLLELYEQINPRVSIPKNRTPDN